MTLNAITKVYLFDPVTKRYKGGSNTKLDPKNPNRVRTPPFSTNVPPPQLTPDYVWLGDAWVYTKSFEKLEMTSIWATNKKERIATAFLIEQGVLTNFPSEIDLLELSDGGAFSNYNDNLKQIDESEYPFLSYVRDNWVSLSSSYQEENKDLLVHFYNIDNKEYLKSETVNKYVPLIANYTKEPLPPKPERWLQWYFTEGRWVISEILRPDLKGFLKEIRKDFTLPILSLLTPVEQLFVFDVFKSADLEELKEVWQTFCVKPEITAFLEDGDRVSQINEWAVRYKVALELVSQDGGYIIK